MALGIVVVEIVPRIASGDTASGPGTQDEFVLRFGEPGGASGPAALAGQGQEGVDYHVVRKGETLSSIASARLGSAARAAELALLNDLTNPDKLIEGQVLRLR